MRLLLRFVMSSRFGRLTIYALYISFGSPSNNAFKLSPDSTYTCINLEILNHHLFQDSNALRVVIESHHLLRMR
ncbi:hypothetical protein DERP_004586 [Dermatophagoides pteronyssinus]|uniref:Secreted protein n=1 Tax=Dermatophagoides pteronyssinus TaxID=6956 RepID=A0ABQ8JP79_DERPT|nr:hypothetical protein DERP_004586 [Dermatophagoides pteronyssinus]